MGTSNLVSPLHLFGLDNHSANLGFSILSRCERDDEVSTFFAIWLKESVLWVNDKLGCRVGSEEGGKLSETLQMVVQLEGDAGGLVERTLDDDHIINLWLKRLKDNVEFPTASSALIDNKLNVGFERSEWLESHLEDKRIIWTK
jgi:hypothetical protein